MRLFHYLFSILALFSYLNFSCLSASRNYDWNPSSFSESVWSSDNEITFYVNGEDENEKILFFKCENCGELNICAEIDTKAEFTVDGNTYSCYVDTCLGDDFMYLISFDVPEIVTLESLDEYIIAKFDVSYKSRNHFTVTVAKSDVFEVGRKYDFYRLENE